MKYIVKLLLIIGLVLPEIFAAAAETPIEGAVVIVGSNRAAGTLIDHIIGIVGQEEGDFSHAKSFPGERVVSVDTRPCALKGLEHIEGDFTETAKFTSGAQKTVVFEWFPGSNGENLLDNQMLKALEKAYDILMPGGTLIIDSHPFFALAPDQKIANLIQRLNPFSLFLTKKEIGQIAVCLGLAKGGRKIPPVYEAVEKSLGIVCHIFKDIEATKIAGDIFDCMKIKEGERALIATAANPVGYMFLWAYHSFSRAALMGAALNGIGFEAEAAEIGFAPENPFNKRKYAWFIQVKKSREAKAAAIDSLSSSAAADLFKRAFQQEKKEKAV